MQNIHKNPILTIEIMGWPCATAKGDLAEIIGISSVLDDGLRCGFVHALQYKKMVIAKKEKSFKISFLFDN